ncbi:hypothetical protein pwc_41 [Weissella phage PWc]|nr:hypothetical protein pwc_41 [Weissella phage PWc]
MALNLIVKIVDFYIYSGYIRYINKREVVHMGLLSALIIFGTACAVFFVIGLLIEFLEKKVKGN